MSEAHIRKGKIMNKPYPPLIKPTHSEHKHTKETNKIKESIAYNLKRLIPSPHKAEQVRQVEQEIIKQNIHSDDIQGIKGIKQRLIGGEAFAPRPPTGKGGDLKKQKTCFTVRKVVPRLNMEAMYLDPDFHAVDMLDYENPNFIRTLESGRREDANTESKNDSMVYPNSPILQTGKSKFSNAREVHVLGENKRSISGGTEFSSVQGSPANRRGGSTVVGMPAPGVRTEGIFNRHWKASIITKKYKRSLKPSTAVQSPTSKPLITEKKVEGINNNKKYKKRDKISKNAGISEKDIRNMSNTELKEKLTQIRSETMEKLKSMNMKIPSGWKEMSVEELEHNENPYGFIPREFPHMIGSMFVRHDYSKIGNFVGEGEPRPPKYKMTQKVRNLTPEHNSHDDPDLDFDFPFYSSGVGGSQRITQRISPQNTNISERPRTGKNRHQLIRISIDGKTPITNFLPPKRYTPIKKREIRFEEYNISNVGSPSAARHHHSTMIDGRGLQSINIQTPYTTKNTYTGVGTGIGTGIGIGIGTGIGSRQPNTIQRNRNSLSYPRRSGSMQLPANSIAGRRVIKKGSLEMKELKGNYNTNINANANAKVQENQILIKGGIMVSDNIWEYKQKQI